MSNIMRAIIAIDIGSSSVRCSAYQVADERANSSAKVTAVENCRAFRTIRLVQPNTGKILLGDQGQKSLMDNVDDCVDEVLNHLRKSDCGAFQVLAIGFSTFVMNLVGVDAEGCIVGDEASISYACNTPGVAQKCRDLRSQLGEQSLEQLYQSTGAPIHSAYALPQLLELYDIHNPNHEQVRASVNQWQTIASICLGRWIGAKSLPISFSEASWTGLLNFRTCQYEASAIELLPEACRRALPPLTDFVAEYCDKQSQSPLHAGIAKKRVMDGARNPYWERWPELRGSITNDDYDAAGGICRLFLGIGDGACANIGSKCCTPSRIAVTVGTSAAARVCLPLPVSFNTQTKTNIQLPKGLFCYRVDRAHVLLGGALTDGGSVVEWVSQLLNLSSKDSFAACMSQVENLLEKDYSIRTQSNMTMVPFLSGERSTGFRDGATGAIIGLTRETTPAHLLKSCLEGVTLRLNAVIVLIRVAMGSSSKLKDDDIRDSIPSLIASGKALEVNGLWRQMLSDCTKLDVVMDSDTEEGTSRGVAVIAATALSTTREECDASLVSDFIDESLMNVNTSQPNAAGGRYWDHARESQDAFLGSISPLFS